MIIYVKAGSANGNGTKERPYATINQAASVAQPGDEVIVAPGIYREYVNPLHAGTPDARITYRSEVPLGAVITGAEELTGWTKHSDKVWTARSARMSGMSTPPTMSGSHSSILNLTFPI